MSDHSSYSNLTNEFPSTISMFATPNIETTVEPSRPEFIEIPPPDPESEPETTDGSEITTDPLLVNNVVIDNHDKVEETPDVVVDNADKVAEIAEPEVTNEPKLEKIEEVVEPELKIDEKKLANMIDNVKEIDNLLEKQHYWNVQSEKTDLLQHQTDSHRSYLYDEKLTKFNNKAKRVEIKIDRIHGVNYFNNIKNGKDLTNTLAEICQCDTYESVIKCKNCKLLRRNISSRSTGEKYDLFNLPKWNITFRGGGLRSENRVFYGNFKVRAKTSLYCNCQSFITFSMLLPIKDPLYPRLGFWEEIALGFSSKNDKSISLFIKSSLTKNEKKEIIIPIEINYSNKKFTTKEYNNYELEWEKHKITILVNLHYFYIHHCEV